MLLAVLLTVLIAWPQLLATATYYPQSIRAGRSADEKQAAGSIPLWRLLKGTVWPDLNPVDGVFGVETLTFVGLPAMLCLIAVKPGGFWWGVLAVSMLLSMGRHTPLFRLTHRLHLRLPCRYTILLSISLVTLTIQGFSSLSLSTQRAAILLQIIHLAIVLPTLLPMTPFVQRWSYPSDAFSSPLASFLEGKSGRVSGLLYPLRTGQINRIMTLGYNGGSQPRWMAEFRGDGNPDGSGAHDWWALNEDGEALDRYGVRWAVTQRPLSGKWIPSQLRRVFENTQAGNPPRWPHVR